MPEFMNIINSLLLDNQAEDEKAVNYQSVSELKQKFDFTLSDEGLNPELLTDTLNKVVRYTPTVKSPNYLSYLYSSPDRVGLIGDWLTSLLNTNVHTYEASPVFSLAETELIKALAEVINYPTKADGVFCPGGSYSNLLGMYLARNHFAPEINEQGSFHHKKLVVFTSIQAHYSIDRAAIMLGIGIKGVYKIKCDQKGRMIADDLKRKIEASLKKGEQPFFVAATLGTTVLGAFDPLLEIQKVLEAYPDIWLHVDAAWGGATLISNKYHNLSKGIKDADSLTWDFHKALNAPILCSVLLVKQRLKLKNIFKDDSSYLFHIHGNNEEEYNLGQKTPQCGRRGDAFKFWLMWKARGKNHFATQMEKRLAIVCKAIALINTTDSFLIYDQQPDFLNIAFWYIPEYLRGIKINEISTKASEYLDKLTIDIYQCLKKDGRFLINYAAVENSPSFLRLVINNDKFNLDHLKQGLDIIKSFGDVLSSDVEKVLISGGDNRLKLDNRGLNYILVAPSPSSKLVSRSSCSGSYISSENYNFLQTLFDNIRSAKISFGECMEAVHQNMRQLLDIGPNTGIITTPSGTDSEYIPLLIAKAQASVFGLRQIVNIVTGMGEVGSSSYIAAKGAYYRPQSPSGLDVNSGESLPGMDNIQVVPVSLRYPTTGQAITDDMIWKTPLLKYLDRPGTIVILHVLDSSKLGYRLDIIEEVETLMERYPQKLLVTIDACQSRLDMIRLRHYLRIGCMVMITGSKFEEGPPFSGALIIPESITDILTENSFVGFSQGLKDFITRYDVSGNIGNILRHYLHSWMNWGLMARWFCGLNNWKRYRKIAEKTRNQFIKDWVYGIFDLIKEYPEIEIFSGGEAQNGAVGSINSIVSIKLKSGKLTLSIHEMKLIYNWLYEDMSVYFKGVQLSHQEQIAVRSSFLVGQPVDLGNFAVLRIALGAKLIFHLNKTGLEKTLEDDNRILLKLSLLLQNYSRLTVSAE